MEQKALLEGDHMKSEPITPGALLVLQDPWDEWNDAHQRERPFGFVVKTYTHKHDPIHPHSYHILFSNGAYEYEMHGYIRGRYKVVG